MKPKKWAVGQVKGDVIRCILYKHESGKDKSAGVTHGL